MTTVALIGYGYSGRTFHAPLIGATPGLELVVVSSRSPSRVHAELPDVAVVASPDEAIAAAEVVVVATPNATHVEIASAALDAGRHVVVDKPLTVTLQDARALDRLAASRGRVLSVFHNRRWDGDFLGVQDVVRRGSLGAIRHFESHFDRYRPIVRDRWREAPGAGSGVWSDLGPHLADQALQLFGLPAAVTAALVAQRPGALTDDWAHVLLHYDALRVVLHASMLVAGGSLRFMVHGTGGSWYKSGLDVQEQQLLSGMAPGAEGWGVDPQPARHVDGATGLESPCLVPAGDYRRFYARLRDAVNGGGANPVPPSHAVAVAAVLETAARSSHEQRTLPLPLTDDERLSFATGTGV